MNSYQKLKEENKLLKQELCTIAKDPTSMDSAVIIWKYKFKIDTAKLAMFGTYKGFPQELR